MSEIIKWLFFRNGWLSRLDKVALKYWNTQKHSNYLRTHFCQENSFWSDGYFACNIGDIFKEIVEKYIANKG